MGDQVIVGVAKEIVMAAEVDILAYVAVSAVVAETTHCPMAE